LTLIGMTIIATVLAPVAGSVPSPSGEKSELKARATNNTTYVSTLSSINRSSFSSTSLDISTALQVSYSNASTRLKRYLIRQRFNAINTPEGRRKYLVNLSQAVLEEATQLLIREKESRQRFQSNRIDAGHYLVILGELHAQAGNLRAIINEINGLRQQLPESGEQIQRSLLIATAKLITLRGPVRSRALHGVLGGQSQGRTFVGVSQRGVVLASIINGDYVHESSFDTEYQPSTLEIGEASEIYKNYYTWGWDSSSARISGLIVAFSSSFAYDHGVVESYLDGTTGTVYREIQRKDISALPSGSATSVSREGLTLVVNRTYPGGPLRVSVHHASGAPANAVIRINGTAVGSTGSDGVLWTIGGDAQFAVIADTGETQLTLFIRPLRDQSS
ncbi:MAG: hypothetical protein ABEI52_01520, partial [Halobacteriaceae archaeon]